jgi:hypothetical protein
MESQRRSGGGGAISYLLFACAIQLFVAVTVVPISYFYFDPRTDLVWKLVWFASWVHSILVTGAFMSLLISLIPIVDPAAEAEAREFRRRAEVESRIRRASKKD